MIHFLQPVYLWLLALPAALLAAWLWQLARRRRDARRYLNGRVLPVRERYAPAGGLSFWLCLILAVACLVAALARPQARVSRERRAGIDFIVLQDGSTSMRVADVRPDRWRRSTACCARSPRP